MKRIKILTVVGARPQFIKSATVSRAIRLSQDFCEVLVHTGQHYDDMMSGVFFRELGITTPEEYCAVHGGGHGAMTGKMLESIEPIILKHNPDWVLVYGDTNSTLAGALVAAKLNIPVIHVEAGLRSFNRRMPEEINRILTDHLSTLCFVPTNTATKNLAEEGITSGVHHVGDVMYDAMLFAMTNVQENSAFLYDLGLERGNFVLATIHRAENTDDPSRLMTLIGAIKTEAAQRTVVLPLHPRTRNVLAKHNIDIQGILTIDPVGYIDMLTLLDGCGLVMTDSGGLQKESYFARRPCITLRDETEWVETIDSGWNRLWTTNNWLSPRTEVSDYGQGNTAMRILEVIRSHET